MPLNNVVLDNCCSVSTLLKESHYYFFHRTPEVRDTLDTPIAIGLSAVACCKHPSPTA